MDSLRARERVDTTCAPRFLLLRSDFGVEGESFEREREGGAAPLLAQVGEHGSGRRRKRWWGLLIWSDGWWGHTWGPHGRERRSILTANLILFSPKFLSLVYLTPNKVLRYSEMNLLESNIVPKKHD